MWGNDVSQALLWLVSQPPGRTYEMDLPSPITLGFLGSLAAGSLTAIGALPVLFMNIPSRATRDLALGFAAGVMLAASFFSLIIPALDVAENWFEGGPAPAAIVCLAILLGMGAIALINEKLPHEHFDTGREGPDVASLRRIWLFIIAIAIHNFPEGLAVGVGFGADGLSGGLPLAIGIGLQNAPEGLAVAVSLVGVGYSKIRACYVSALTGLVEPIGGLLGASVITLSQSLLPWGLAFAAGAMLYVISHEIIPETHRSGHQNRATLGLAIGLVIMMFLDVWLGG
jgi:ZIP family zinc transporter